MNNSMVPLRTVILTLALLIGIVFWTGVLFWNKSNYKCYSGRKHFYGDWRTVMSFGQLDIRVKEWGCEPKDRYDPRVSKPLWEVKP